MRLYAWKLLLAQGGRDLLGWPQQLHLTWLLDALLATPAIGGPSLSFSTIGTFIVFVYMWLPFMVLPIMAVDRAHSGLATSRPRATSAPTRAPPSAR